MKKIATLTAAFGLMATMAATASAAEVTGTTAASPTVTGSTYTAQFETIFTPATLKPATPQIILTKVTAFYSAPGSTYPFGLLAPQTVDTTGEVIVDALGTEWREIYTWLGKAWVAVPDSANVVAP